MKHSLWLLIAVVGLLISCSKNNGTTPDEPTPPPAGSIKIKTFTGDNGTTTFTHDSQGRLATRLYPNGGKEEYDYSTPNKIIKKYYFPDGSLDGTGDLDLNAAGLVIKGVYSDGGPNLYTYEYDAEKNLVKMAIEANGNATIVDYFYTNGNLDSSRYKLNGNHHSTTHYTYYTDKADLLNNDVYGQGYEGYFGKYLLKKEQTHYADGDQKAWDYSYEFDSKGRVSKRTIKNGQNQEVGLYTYY
jgi:YD repeat-containing protein